MTLHPQEGYSYHLRVGTVFSGATVYYTDTAQPETVALWIEEILGGEVLRAVGLGCDEQGCFTRVYFWTPAPLFLTQKPSLDSQHTREEDTIADETHREENAS